MLCLCPVGKLLVYLKSLVLGLEQDDLCVACVIVCEHDIVLVTSDCLNWQWAPQIGVDFGPECVHNVCDTFLVDNLARGLHVFA